MTLNSSVVVAGQDGLAADWNNLRLDILTHESDTLTDTGAADAYIVTVDNQITSLVTKQKIKMVAANSNTGASTLRFKNGLSLDVTDTIKSPTGSDIVAGDIVAGGIYELIFNGTDWQLFISGLSKATQDEAEEGTNDAKYLTPLSAISSVRRWGTLLKIYLNATFGGATTQFDITDEGNSIFRYTFDGTGTDPNITTSTMPVGLMLDIDAQNFNVANNGLFRVVASGTNYFKVYNTSGVAETNKTIGTGSIVGASGAGAWVKDSAVKFIDVWLRGGGAGGGGGRTHATSAYGGTGGGGGALKIGNFLAKDLGATETITIGAGGAGGAAGAPASDGVAGGNSSFGSLLTAYGGGKGGGGGGGKNGGAGGGTAGAGADASTSAIIGGLPALVAGVNGISGQGAGAAAPISGTPPDASNAEYGGGSGGQVSTNITAGSKPGGSSIYAGGAGGGAGSFDSGSGAMGSGAGGASGSYAVGGGGAGGAGSAGAAGTAGTDRISPVLGGDGGGGGATNTAGTGGTGGKGGLGGGGGGGGGGGTTGGIGGAGGDGLIIVLEHY